MKNNKFLVKTLNNISNKGLDILSEDYIIDNEEKDPHALLVRSAKIHNMEFSENTIYIGRAGAGVNNIPLERCSEKGIVVCNAPSANANGVKELVVAAMLLASRNLLEAIEWANNLKGDNIEKEVEAGKKKFVGPELTGKNLGLIGLGAIGNQVASIGTSLNMNVYGYDPYLSVENAVHLNSEINYVNNLEEMFMTCDYISLHIPLNENTKNIINENHFKIAKPGMILLNMARGGLVDNIALRKALEKGIVSKYVIDFPSSETIDLPNTINIPHLGACTPESEENSAKMVVIQMMDLLERGKISNSVNFPDLDPGILTAEERICIYNRNIPTMIGQITNILSEKHINITEMTNKNKGDWAYTVIDIEDTIDNNTLEKIKAIEGVVRVRTIRR